MITGCSCTGFCFITSVKVSMVVRVVAVVEAVTEDFSLFFSLCDDHKNFTFIKTYLAFNALLFSCFTSRKGKICIFFYNKPTFVIW